MNRSRRVQDVVNLDDLGIQIDPSLVNADDDDLTEFGLISPESANPDAPATHDDAPATEPPLKRTA